MGAVGMPGPPQSPGRVDQLDAFRALQPPVAEPVDAPAVPEPPGPPTAAAAPPPRFTADPNSPVHFVNTIRRSFFHGESIESVDVTVQSEHTRNDSGKFSGTVRCTVVVKDADGNLSTKTKDLPYFTSLEWPKADATFAERKRILEEHKVLVDVYCHTQKVLSDPTNAKYAELAGSVDAYRANSSSISVKLRPDTPPDPDIPATPHTYTMLIKDAASRTIEIPWQGTADKVDAVTYQFFQNGGAGAASAPPQGQLPMSAAREGKRVGESEVFMDQMRTTMGNPELRALKDRERLAVTAFAEANEPPGEGEPELQLLADYLNDIEQEVAFDRAHFADYQSRVLEPESQTRFQRFRSKLPGGEGAKLVPNKQYVAYVGKHERLTELRRMPNLDANQQRELALLEREVAELDPQYLPVRAAMDRIIANQEKRSKQLTSLYLSTMPIEMQRQEVKDQAERLNNLFREESQALAAHKAARKALDPVSAMKPEDIALQAQQQALDDYLVEAENAFGQYQTELRQLDSQMTQLSAIEGRIAGAATPEEKTRLYRTEYLPAYNTHIALLATSNASRSATITYRTADPMNIERNLGITGLSREQLLVFETKLDGLRSDNRIEPPRTNQAFLGHIQILKALPHGASENGAVSNFIENYQSMVTLDTQREQNLQRLGDLKTNIDRAGSDEATRLYNTEYTEAYRTYQQTLRDLEARRLAVEDGTGALANLNQAAPGMAAVNHDAQVQAEFASRPAQFADQLHIDNMDLLRCLPPTAQGPDPAMTDFVKAYNSRPAATGFKILRRRRAKVLGKQQTAINSLINKGKRDEAIDGYNKYLADYQLYKAEVKDSDDKNTRVAQQRENVINSLPAGNVRTAFIERFPPVHPPREDMVETSHQALTEKLTVPGVNIGPNGNLVRQPTLRSRNETLT